MSVRFFSFGPFRLDAEEQVLLREGRPLPLKPKAFELLSVLVAHSGHVVSKDELMKTVWADSFVEEGNVAVSVHEIRKALDGDLNGESYIETVPRRGYRFVAGVTETREKEVPGVEMVDERKASSEGLVEGTVQAARVTIAVLPFKSIGAASNAYLGLGMTDALITRLSNLRQVAVRPTTSVRRYSGSHDPVSAGKELGVEWVLDGSVQKSGKRIRLTVQLLHVGDGVLRWADKFDEKFTDIFTVEDSVSEQVAKALEPQLTGDDRRLLTKRYTENLAAYEAYLKGRYFFEKRTPDACKKGIDYFEIATNIDPGFALAYAALAACHIVMASNSAHPTRDSYSKAQQAITIALLLNDDLAEAHGSLGQLKVRGWDWIGAEREFRRAIELNPNYAEGYSWYALYLGMLGRFDEAFGAINKAKQFDPLSTVIKSSEGSLLYMSRRYDDAVALFDRMLKEQPEFAIAHSLLGLAFEAKGDYESALTHYEKSIAAQGALPELISFRARVRALTGQESEARRAIKQLESWPEYQTVHPHSIALIYAALGDVDEMFRWLETALAERDEDLIVLKVDARLDAMRDDERFKRILRDVGFPTE